MLREVTVENGKLRGIPGADPRVTIFRGVPFAAPPVGANRWRAPQPCPDWEGVREAYTFAPISVQDQPGIGDNIYNREWHVDPDIPMNEDCLYLNVFTPAKSTDEKLPVLVWIFGGGFQWGYTAEMEFDGERLARRGVIVVSVNYRLASLGFLAHPEITAESPDAPGNFGLLDQQAGIKWVKRNIAAFGGDPDHITIAGQSAGGGSVMNQITCEANYGLLSGAVILSGIINPPNSDDDMFRPKNLADAEKLGEEFFEFLGVKSLEEARKLDAFHIRDEYAKFVKEHHLMVPITDGVLIKEYPVERFKRGDYADIPVIAGFTADEFVYNGVNIVEKSVKEVFDETIKAPGRKPLYAYGFEPDIPGWDHPGCFHSVDLWFFFESLGKCWRPFKGHHYDLARFMCNYLADFIKTGDPNGKDADGEDMTTWKPYSEGKFIMHFTSDGPKEGV